MLSMVVAAVAATPFGYAGAVRNLDRSVIVIAVASAILLPLLPYALEMWALRRMTASALSTLMSFEPALACLIGFVLLSQRMSIVQLVGIAFVIAAGLAAVRHGHRVDPQISRAGVSSASESVH